MKQLTEAERKFHQLAYWKFVGYTIDDIGMPKDCVLVNEVNPYLPDKVVMVPKRTCKSSYCPETDEWQCSECEGTLQTCVMFDPEVDGFVSTPKFCPNCGAEVVDE